MRTGGRGAIALNEDGGKEVAYRARRQRAREWSSDMPPVTAGCGQAANWFKVILDQTGLNSASSVTSFAISGGTRHITYYDADDEELRYATCASDCTNAAMWQKSPIDTDIQAVAKLLRAVRTLRTAACELLRRVSGRSQVRPLRLELQRGQKLEKGDRGIDRENVGWYPSMAVEPNGRVHVSYYGSLQFRRCPTPHAFSDCMTASGWSESVLDGFQSIEGDYPSLVARNGVAEISYYDRTNGNLKYLRRTP